MDKDRTRRSFLLTMALVALYIGGACAPAAGPSPAATQEPKPAASAPAPQATAGASIKVGLINPTTGQYGSMGTAFNDGVSLAVEEVNAKGGVGGRKLAVVFEDNQSDPQVTTGIVRKMAADKDILIIFGPTPIVAAQPGTVVAEQEGISMIAMAPTRSQYEGKKYVFTAGIPEDIAAQGMAQFANRQLKLKKVGILRDPTEYGQLWARFFPEAATKEGMQVVVDSYQMTDVDASPQLLKLKTAGVDGLVIAGGPPKVPSVILKNMDSMGWKVPVLLSASLNAGAFFELAGPLSEGIYLESYFGYDSAAQTALEKGLFQAYKAKGLPGAPVMFHGQGWDIVHMASAAIAKGANDRAKLRDAIEQTKGFMGATGEVNMSSQDHNGHSADSFTVVKMEKGQLKFAWSPRLK